ncbi:MAG TPA: DUF4157 domain-containing protein [Pyrinomonadaceae bacterium]|nr:DUF4157 domain-containing protein [Pyrinomonadaceae bacterium]
MRLVREVLRSAGRPLDASARALMEPRFGQDFSRVRVHADDGAARAARSIDAHAFTVGRHIVFGEGRYTTSDERGRFTLAHELAHVVQQGETDDAAPSALRIQPESDPHEHEADRVAAQVVRAPADTRGATTTTHLPVSRAWRSSLARLPRGSVQRQMCVETYQFPSQYGDQHEIIERWYKQFHPPLLHEFTIPINEDGHVLGRADLVDRASTPGVNAVWEIMHPSDTASSKRVQLNNYLRLGQMWCGRGEQWRAGDRLPRAEIPPWDPILIVEPIEPGLLRYNYRVPEGQRYPYPSPIRTRQLRELLERILRGVWGPSTPPLVPAPARYQGYPIPGHGSEESGVRVDATEGFEVRPQEPFRPTLAPEVTEFFITTAGVLAVTMGVVVLSAVLTAALTEVLAGLSVARALLLLSRLRALPAAALRAISALPRADMVRKLTLMAAGAEPASAR